MLLGTRLSSPHVAFMLLLQVVWVILIFSTFCLVPIDLGRQSRHVWLYNTDYLSVNPLDLLVFYVAIKFLFIVFIFSIGSEEGKDSQFKYNLYVI